MELNTQEKLDLLSKFKAKESRIKTFPPTTTNRKTKRLVGSSVKEVGGSPFSFWQAFNRLWKYQPNCMEARHELNIPAPHSPPKGTHPEATQFTIITQRRKNSTHKKPPNKQTNKQKSVFLTESKKQIKLESESSVV